MASGGIKLAFGPSKSLATKAKKSIAKPSAFGGLDDDDSSIPTSHRPITTNSSLSRLQRQKQEEAKQIESSVYEYDEVYDGMKAAERLVEKKRAAENADRKPKYIEGLLRTAEIRKADRIRAEDKMVERERQKEGDEFADKDAFVTTAYQEQQAKLRKAEEEENLREASQKGIARGGMAAFYSNYLDSTDVARKAAVQASTSIGPRPIQGPTPKPVESEGTVSEAQLAEDASQRLGRHIQVNEDGEIVDKRELLVGGLNVNLPKVGGISLAGLAGPTKPSGFALPISQRGSNTFTTGRAGESGGGVTNAETARRGFLARQRLSSEMERQMLELEEKKRKADADQLERGSAKMAKRNDASRIEELKRKALERRKERENDSIG